MTVRFSSAISFNLLVLPFFTGKNPSNKNLSDGKPELTRAGIKAVAPGRHSISILFLMHSRINKNPGSEIPGVPASEINAIWIPLFYFSIIDISFLCSLCTW